MPDPNDRRPSRRPDEQTRRRRSSYEEDEEFDDEDEVVESRDRDRRKPAKKRGALETLVPLKNGLALASYYCGVFSLIPAIGFILGPVAIVLGILGINKAKKNPRVAGAGHAITWIVLGIIGIILWPIVWFTFLGKMMK